jgi:hypothetical protein
MPTRALSCSTRVRMGRMDGRFISPSLTLRSRAWNQPTFHLSVPLSSSLCSILFHVVILCSTSLIMTPLSSTWMQSTTSHFSFFLFLCIKSRCTCAHHTHVRTCTTSDTKQRWDSYNFTPLILVFTLMFTHAHNVRYEAETGCSSHRSVLQLARVHTDADGWLAANRFEGPPDDLELTPPPGYHPPSQPKHAVWAIDSDAAVTIALAEVNRWFIGWFPVVNPDSGADSAVASGEAQQQQQRVRLSLNQQQKEHQGAKDRTIINRERQSSGRVQLESAKRTAAASLHANGNDPTTPTTVVGWSNGTFIRHSTFPNCISECEKDPLCTAASYVLPPNPDPDGIGCSLIAAVGDSNNDPRWRTWLAAAHPVRANCNLDGPFYTSRAVSVGQPLARCACTRTGHARTHARTHTHTHTHRIPAHTTSQQLARPRCTRT